MPNIKSARKQLRKSKARYIENVAVRSKVKTSRRKFDKTFKYQAVELWLKSNKAATEVAAELGIHAQRLSAWRKRFAPYRTARSR